MPDSTPDGLFSTSSIGELSYRPPPANSTRRTLPSSVTGRKSYKTLKQRPEAVWPPSIEAVFFEALEKYRPPAHPRPKGLRRFPKRNKFISDYILEVTGTRRTPKQVGSRIQQLRDTCKEKRILHLLTCREFPEDKSKNEVTGSTSPTSGHATLTLSPTCPKATPPESYVSESTGSTPPVGPSLSHIHEEQRTEANLATPAPITSIPSPESQDLPRRERSDSPSTIRPFYPYQAPQEPALSLPGPQHEMGHPNLRASFVYVLPELAGEPQLPSDFPGVEPIPILPEDAYRHRYSNPQDTKTDPCTLNLLASQYQQGLRDLYNSFFLPISGFKFITPDDRPTPRPSSNPPSVISPDPQANHSTSDRVYPISTTGTFSNTQQIWNTSPQNAGQGYPLSSPHCRLQHKDSGTHKGRIKSTSNVPIIRSSSSSPNSNFDRTRPHDHDFNQDSETTNLTTASAPTAASTTTLENTIPHIITTRNHLPHHAPCSRLVSNPDKCQLHQWGYQNFGSPMPDSGILWQARGHGLQAEHEHGQVTLNLSDQGCGVPVDGFSAFEGWQWVSSSGGEYGYAPGR
ncbi:hypothetical protein AX16_006147 [Volvariella volvacea WC 439]|nr:hypothetical protein AX16_006147 [Volvariella volvacea WC 439]